MEPLVNPGLEENAPVVANIGPSTGGGPPAPNGPPALNSRNSLFVPFYTFLTV